MADLQVDGVGLTAAAVGSVDIADALAAAGAVDAPGMTPSQAGIAAVNAALARARERAARRADGQGTSLHTGDACYTDTDGGAADSVSRSV